MAVGDLVVDPMVYEFRNLAFGHGTDIMVEQMTGLLSAPGVIDQDVNRQNRHGYHPGVATFGKRTIAFDFKLMGVGGAPVEERMADVREAFQLPRIRYSRVMDEFVFQRPGEVKKVLYVRCTKRDIPSTYEAARGLVSGSVELVAPDPVIYSLAVHSQDIVLAAAALNNGAGATVTNAGDLRDGTDPVITIVGPVTDPVVQNLTDDARQFKLEGVFDANDEIRINFQTRVVEIRESSGDPWVEDYSIVKNDSKWWSLLPGANTIYYERAAGNAASSSTLTISYQDSWQ